MSSPVSDSESVCSPLTNLSETAASPGPEESLPSEDGEDGYCRSALWRSLYVLSQEPRAVNDNTVSSVPSANNPRPLRVMGDNAEYWVNDSGEIFTFKFPGTLDLEGQYDRSGPYFNLPRTGLDLFALKRMRAQFEVRPLDVSATDVYPQEAIRCSSTALDMLNVLHGEAEDARNALLPNPSVYPRDVPFWRHYGDGDNKRLSLVLTTDALVQNIPDPSRSSMPRLKRSDIGKSDTMQSPCMSSLPFSHSITNVDVMHKAKAKAKAVMMPGGSPGGSEGSSALAHSLITQYHLEDALVVAPSVRAGNGVLIKPAEYGTKLTNGDHVMVECQVNCTYTLFVIAYVDDMDSSWNIGPNKRENAPPEEKHGSRRYQVMLKSMKLLPDAAITAKTSHNFRLSNKGKRKASDEGEGSRATKKVSRDEDSEDDNPRDDIDSSSTGLHAMQTDD
ncbi:hypothetical protein EDD22DRAFT_842525 [Suillus occidentalis]|nr:hypothetical protein EDD22DRAFT_842525 [Suillus occidentalis]